MNNVELEIGSLQKELNDLLEDVKEYTEVNPEIYELSERLDRLILVYYTYSS